MLIRFSLVVLSFLAITCFAQAQTESYTIQLLIQDDAQDKPLEQVEVWLSDQLLGMSDAKGEFLFKEAKPGARYTFSVRKAGYEVKSESRFAKEAMNQAVTPMSLRKITTLIDTYQELLKNDCPEVKRMENLYRIIIESVDAERNLKLKNEFIAENNRIKQSNAHPYKVDLQPRDGEIKPIIKDNLNKLSEFKR